MRTKTAVLTAAALAAGALSSMAQNVYSLNVVGYINLSMASGYSLVANQLVGADTTLNTVFGTGFSVDGYQVITWNAGSQGFNQPDTFYTAATAGTAGWYDSSFASAPVSPAVGQGFVYLNTGTSALTWVNAFSVQ